MINIRKAAAALCLSGFVIGGTASTALASTASTSQATSTAQFAQVTSTAQFGQMVGYWCGYQVVRAPDGLYVRSGPSTYYRVIGGLANGQWTTGSCTTVRGWVHLSSRYNHYYWPASARGWSYGYYLSRPAPTVYWCGYQVVRAPDGLYVRSGPSTYYRVIGGLANGQWTTGSCTTVRGWVHLSSRYNHYYWPASARGWSYGYYLSR